MKEEIKKYLDSANFKFKDVDENEIETELTLNETIEKLVNDSKILANIIKNQQERIVKALDYIEKIYNSNTEIVENSKGEHIDVGYAVPALEDIENILKGEDK